MQATATTYMHSPPAPYGKQLRLLCLDGGGVRGLSSLLILQKVMEMIEPDEPPKPCDYFDMIGGTSTGGLIAIMLGRLQMSVQECIDEYLTLFSVIFTKKKHRIGWSGKLQGRFDHEALEDGIKRVVKQRLGDEEALFKDTSHRGGCKTFVCATSQATSETVIMSSYYSDRRANDIRNTVRIWEVGRATSAAMSFFDPIQIRGSTFLDGGTGANNPINSLWAEARDIFSDRSDWKLEDNVLCLVSIGTGQPVLQKFGDSVLGTEVLDALVKITTNTESVANEFQQSHATLFEQGLAYRFNVEQGLENVALEDTESVPMIEEATRRFISIEKSNSMLRKCVSQLTVRENCEIIPLKILERFSADWSSWKPLHESELQLCFIPHTSAFANWSTKGGILSYQKPPIYPGETLLSPIGCRILTTVLEQSRSSQENSEVQPKFILYHDCTSESDLIAILATWSLQLLASPISSLVRYNMSIALFGTDKSYIDKGSSDVLAMMCSILTLERLQTIILAALPHLQGPLFIGLDNLNHLAYASRQIPEKKSVLRGILANLLMTCVQVKSDTFVVVSDTAAMKRSPSVRDSQAEFFQVQWNTEWRECLSTLDFDRRMDRQKEIVRAEFGTVAWFWRHPTYLLWRDKKSGILWIQGKPGSGKSVLAKNILNPVDDPFQSTTDDYDSKTLSREVGTQVCEWYYSTRGGDELMAHVSLLRSLLYQLLSSSPQLFDHFKTAYRGHSPKSCDWIGLENLKSIFKSISVAGTSALCLIDAMDESENDISREARRHILSFFASVASKNKNSRLKFLILSRPEDDIEMFFTRYQNHHDDLGVIKLHEANGEAIRIIINAGMDSFNRELRPSEYSETDSDDSLRKRNKRIKRRLVRQLLPNKTSHRRIAKASHLAQREPEELRKIKEFLLNNAQGVILWVTVTIATVKSVLGPKFYTWKQILEELEKLPTDLTALYKRIVEDICSRLDDQQLKIARKILMWTTGANLSHPLRIVELRDAISVPEPGNGFDLIVNIKWEDFRYRLRRYCGPFLDIVQVKSERATDKQGKELGGNPITRFDQVQLLHRTAKDFLADPDDAKSLHFTEDGALYLVSMAMNAYADILKEFLETTKFRASIRGIARGAVINFIQELVNYIDDRALLHFVLALRESREGHSEYPMDATEFLIRNPLRILQSNGIGNLRVHRAIEASWFGGGIEARGDTSMENKLHSTVLAPMFFGECFLEACLGGRITAVEILLRMSMDFAHDREESPRFFSETIHSLLLASVELKIEDLSYVLANMSLSVHDGNTDSSGLDASDDYSATISSPHKLWQRRNRHEKENMFANHLEIVAAETGCERLVNMITQTTNDILRCYDGSFKTQTSSQGANLIAYAKEFYQDDDSADENDEVDSRIALELAIDHLKVTFGGFKAMRQLSQFLSSHKIMGSALQVKLAQATSLYHTTGNTINPRLKRAQYLMRLYGMRWLRSSPVYYRVHGFHGVVTRILEQIREAKLEDSDGGADLPIRDIHSAAVAMKDRWS